MNVDNEGVRSRGRPSASRVHSKCCSSRAASKPFTRDVLSDLILGQSRHAGSFSNCVVHGAADLPPHPPPLPPPTMARLREPRLRDASEFTSAKSMTVTLRIHQPAGPPLSSLISWKYHRNHLGVCVCVEHVVRREAEGQRPPPMRRSKIRTSGFRCATLAP